jgi:hypothetical protein
MTTPHIEEDEDEYELTLLGKVVIPLGDLLVRLDGGSAPTSFRGWTALIQRLIRRHLVLLLGTLAALVVAAAIVIYFATRTTPAPSTAAAAKLVLRHPTGQVPAVASADYLAVSYGGVKFPNYTSMNAVATGQLSKAIDGRPAMTVFYRLRGGKRLSYTVFSVKQTRSPRRARVEYFDGVGLDTYDMQGLTVVTAVRDGRMTVTASSAPRSTVLALAAAPILRGSLNTNSGCAACG